VRRRARETFVLGAERVFDEAELDLRNEAEADHEPIIERDHAAPVEPAIAPQAPPAAPPAGAGARRGREPSGLGRKPRRPRPSVRALLVGGAAVGALGVALIHGGGEDGVSDRALVDASIKTKKPAPARVAKDRAGTPDPAGRRPGVRRDGSARAAPDTSSRRRSSAPTTSQRSPVVETGTAPPPTVSPAPVYPSVPTPAPVESGKPLQSAASVRQEFGP
jgi:hypothetical protein